MNTRIIKSLFALLCVGFLLNASLAQQTSAPAPAKQSQPDRIELHQALLDLTNPWTVMCIAAHPDDEDGTSLIVMRRKHGAHTVSLFTTFGEGGQNAIGPELYEELGAIRVKETIAASEIQGSEPHFLGMKDFGFSKSAEEAFRIWGHEESLRRMVLQIRKLRPDVIITNHDTSRGHGHHQATGQLILEAFEAAADPKRFSEQLKEGVRAWQVQRVFVRGLGGAQQPQQNPDRQLGLEKVVTIDPNERDPIRGTTYAEQALLALQQHATQGPWPRSVADMARFRNSPDGKLPLIRYRLIREANNVALLAADSHNFLDGLALPETVEAELKAPTLDGRPLYEFSDDPGRVLAALLAARRKGYASLANFLRHPNQHHLSRIVMRAQHALATAAGIKIDFTPSQPVFVPGTLNTLLLKLANTGEKTVVIDQISIPADSVTQTSGKVLGPQATIDVAGTIRIPKNSKPNLPQAAHLYDVDPFGLVLGAGVYLKIDGERLFLNPKTRVDLSGPLEITNLSPSPIVRTPAATKSTPTAKVNCAYRDSEFDLRLTNRQDSPFSGELNSGSSPGTRTSSRKVTIPPHQSITVAASVSGCHPWIDSQKGPAKAPTVSFTLVDRGGTKPTARLDVPLVWAYADVTPNLNVGYLRGFDYSLPNALAALGVESKELSVADVRAGDLQKYSAILVDNRVYESQPELIATNQHLLDYAKAGGTLIVFYHKSNEWNPSPRVNRPQLAPYPIVLGDQRVTDENAPVNFIDPQHPLLSSPNKIEEADFAGWIQERGLYYPKEWDAHYKALLAMNDPGEAPLRGGLLVADYGRGHYIYTSMVWYRQLRAGVPGAYRMLANMISYRK